MPQPFIKVARARVLRLVQQNTREMIQQIDASFAKMERELAQIQQAKQKPSNAENARRVTPITTKPVPTDIDQGKKADAQATDPELTNFLNFMAKQDANGRTQDVPNIEQ